MLKKNPGKMHHGIHTFQRLVQALRNGQIRPKYMHVIFRLQLRDHVLTVN